MRRSGVRLPSWARSQAGRAARAGGARTLRFDVDAHDLAWPDHLTCAGSPRAASAISPPGSIATPTRTEHPNHCHSCSTSRPHGPLRRIRMGPVHDDGSTTRPPWVISTSPAATRRRAAARAGSIRSCLPSGSTDRAASPGQMVAPRALAGQQRADRSFQRRVHGLHLAAPAPIRAEAHLVPVGGPGCAPGHRPSARGAGLRFQCHSVVSGSIPSSHRGDGTEQSWSQTQRSNSTVSV